MNYTLEKQLRGKRARIGQPDLRAEGKMRRASDMAMTLNTMSDLIWLTGVPPFPYREGLGGQSERDEIHDVMRDCVIR